VVGFYMPNLTSVTVVFNVPVNATAESIANYSFGVGSNQSVVAAQRTASHDTVLLSLASPHVPGMIDTVFVQNVESEASATPMLGVDTLVITFFNPTTPALLLTELLYNDPSSGDVLEFIEIMNVGTADAELAGFVFGQGISGLLPQYTLGPNEVVVIGRNGYQADFQAAFGFAPQLTFGGNLSNSGEAFGLYNSLGDTLIYFQYGISGNWPPEPNHGTNFEAAFSLSICDVFATAPYDPCNWSYSVDVAGVYPDGLGNQDELFASPGFLGESMCAVALDTDNLPLCPGVPVLLEAEMAGDHFTEAAYTILWSFGGTQPIVTYSPLVTDSLITATATRGVCVFYEELPLPVVNLRVNLAYPDTVSGGQAIYQVLAPVPGQTFAWAFGCGAPTAATGPGPHTVSYPTPAPGQGFQACPWSLTVSSQGCTYTYNNTVYNGQVTSAQELFAINPLSVYPNPTDGELNVRFSFGEPQLITLQISDAAGRVVLNRQVDVTAREGVAVLSLQDLTPGVYSLTATTAQGVRATQRVIKFE
jgi:hypothetical protein